MSQDNLFTLKCSKCNEINYVSSRNKRSQEEKLTLNKHCSRCGAHTPHKQTKKLMK